MSGLSGGRGETRTLTAINRWNLNPVRLPISPLARGVGMRIIPEVERGSEGRVQD